MFTECPACHTVYGVGASNLRLAMGMVRCEECSRVFNALVALRDDPGDSGLQVRTLGDQVHFVASGDRILLQADSPIVRSMRQQLLEVGPATNLAEPAGQTEAMAQPAPQSGSLAGAVQETAEPSTTFEPALPRWRTLLDIGTSRLLPGYLSLAFRSLLRAPRRTAIAFAAIVFGVVAIMLAGGFMEWIFWAMRVSEIHSRLGHLQVVRQGYFEAGAAEPFAYLLPANSLAQKAIEETEGVVTVAPRLFLSGLISHGEVSVSFLGQGVDPAREKDLSTEVHISAGEDLTGDPTQIVLGAGLAENLGVKPGDTVTLLATTGTGGLGGVDARVNGLFYTSSKAFDDLSVRMPITLAQQLLKVEGSHSWVILLNEDELTDSVLEQLRTRLNSIDKGLEVVPWYALADFYHKTVRLFSKQLNIVRLIVACIIVLSISNLLIMSVQDRIAEIGTLMAVGFSAARIRRLFMGEGIVLGTVGGLLGVCIGWLLSETISAIGIPMPPAPGQEVGFTAAIRITAWLSVGGFILALSTAILASVYPAIRASRLPIVDALRHAA